LACSIAASSGVGIGGGGAIGFGGALGLLNMADMGGSLRLAIRVCGIYATVGAAGQRGLTLGVGPEDFS
jgi:hypothetical protein